MQYPLTSLLARLSTGTGRGGRIKCNIGVSFSNEWNGTCIGICVRDDDGAFVLTKTMSFSPLCLVNVGEALRLFHALQWLSDMHMDNGVTFQNSTILLQLAKVSFLLNLQTLGSSSIDDKQMR